MFKIKFIKSFLALWRFLFFFILGFFACFVSFLVIFFLSGCQEFLETKLSGSAGRLVGWEDRTEPGPGAGEGLSSCSQIPVPTCCMVLIILLDVSEFQLLWGQASLLPPSSTTIVSLKRNVFEHVKVLSASTSTELPQIG